MNRRDQAQLRELSGKERQLALRVTRAEQRKPSLGLQTRQCLLMGVGLLSFVLISILWVSMAVSLVEQVVALRHLALRPPAIFYSPPAACCSLLLRHHLPPPQARGSSCGFSCGFRLPIRRATTPLDALLLATARVFPLDALLLACLALLAFSATSPEVYSEGTRVGHCLNRCFRSAGFGCTCFGCAPSSHLRPRGSTAPAIVWAAARIVLVGVTFAAQVCAV